VEHDLDRRVGEQLRDRGHVDLALERIDQVDTRLALGAGVIVDGDLHQAQERPVAALGHEFGIDADTPVLAREARRRRHVVGGGDGACAFAAGGLGAH
jgi:hypothetical protein